MLIERIAPIAQDLNGKRIVTTTDRDGEGNVVATRVYEIEPAPDGRLIFEVENEDDIGTFLSIKDGYRIVKAANAPKTVKGGLVGAQASETPREKPLSEYVQYPDSVVPEDGEEPPEEPDDGDDITLDDTLAQFASKQSLYDWALEAYDIKLDKRRNLKNMKKQLKQKVEG